MKASEWIERLQELISAFGDVNVTFKEVNGITVLSAKIKDQDDAAPKSNS